MFLVRIRKFWVVNLITILLIVCSHFFLLLGGISSSVLSVFFTDKFYKLLKSLLLIGWEQNCQWKTLTKCLMKCPPDFTIIGSACILLIPYINRRAHGIMSLNQWLSQWRNDIMPCAGKRVNDIMPCARRFYVIISYSMILFIYK